MERLEKLNDIENQHDTCLGGSTDKRLLEFVTKMVVLFCVLVFSCVMVAKHDENQQVYINLIAMILSILFPSPGVIKN